MYLKKEYHPRENDTKTQYENESIQILGMDDPKNVFYQLFYDKNNSDDPTIIQYFIIQGLGLCIKVDSYMEHMFYVWSFIHNKSVPIAIKKNKYFIYLNTNTTVFDWGAGNSNKI